MMLKPLSVLVLWMPIVSFAKDGGSEVGSVSFDAIETVSELPTPPNKTPGKKLVYSPNGERYAYVLYADGRWQVVVDGELGKSYDELGVDQRVFFSADSRHFAYVARDGWHWHAVVDGKEGSPFQAISSPFNLSPDGTRVAYEAKQDDRAVWVIEGPDGPILHPLDQDARNSLTVSANLQTVAVVRPETRTVSGKEMRAARLVINGKEVSAYDEIRNVSLSADGSRTAYDCLERVERAELEPLAPQGKMGKKQNQNRKPQVTVEARRYVVVDGKRFGPYEQIDGPVQFSADSKRFAVGVQKKRERLGVNGKSEFDFVWRLLIDGEEFGLFSELGNLNAAAAKRPPVHFGNPSELGIASRDVTCFAPYYPSNFQRRVRFSPDMKHYLSIARRLANQDGRGGHKSDAGWVLIHDGHELGAFQMLQSPVFSPDSSRFAVAAVPLGSPNEQVMVIDGKASKGYANVGSPVFSPNSRRVAFLAQQHGKRLVVVDGQDGSPEEFLAEQFGVFFSADSRHVGYVAEVKTPPAGFAVVVDGRPGMRLEPSAFEWLGFTPDSQRLLGVNGGEIWVDDTSISSGHAQRTTVVFPTPTTFRFLAVGKAGASPSGVYRVEGQLLPSLPISSEIELPKGCSAESASFTNNTQQLAVVTSCTDQQQPRWALRLFDLSTTHEERTIPLRLSGTSSSASDVVMSADGKRAIVLKGADVGLWNLDTGELEKPLVNYANRDGSTLSSSPDGALFGIAFPAANGAPPAVVLWDSTSLEERARIEKSDAFAFSSDGAMLATLDTTNTRIWNLKSGDLMSEWVADLSHSTRLNSVQLSADGTRLYQLYVPTGGTSESAYVVMNPIAREGEAKRFPQIGNRPASAKRGWLGPGGRVLAWSVGDEARIAAVEIDGVYRRLRHGGRVQSVEFAKDASTVATLGAGNIKVWSIGEFMKSVESQTPVARLDASATADGKKRRFVEIAAQDEPRPNLWKLTARSPATPAPQAATPGNQGSRVDEAAAATVTVASKPRDPEHPAAESPAAKRGAVPALGDMQRQQLGFLRTMYEQQLQNTKDPAARAIIEMMLTHIRAVENPKSNEAADKKPSTEPSGK